MTVRKKEIGIQMINKYCVSLQHIKLHSHIATYKSLICDNSDTTQNFVISSYICDPKAPKLHGRYREIGNSL